MFCNTMYCTALQLSILYLWPNLHPMQYKYSHLSDQTTELRPGASLLSGTVHLHGPLCNQMQKEGIPTCGFFYDMVRLNPDVRLNSRDLGV